MSHEKNQFTVTQDAINVIAGNPGLTFSDADLRDLAAGTLVLVPGPVTPIFPGRVFPQVLKRCITHLRFQNGDNDLTQITLDDGTYYTNVQITNLNEFRERLQEAACCGHAISFCYYKQNRHMNMLNVFPCECKCECKKDDQ